MTGVKHTPDGMLDISTCPRCEDATFLSVAKSGFDPVKLWFCERCGGWWRQVKGRDATWVVQFEVHEVQL